MSQKHFDIGKQTLESKNHFCDFIYSRGNDIDGYRDRIFDAINAYKKINSIGTYRNNNNVGLVKMDDKYSHQLGSKFSIAVEGLIEPGYISEKLLDSFAAKTVPIYFGHKETIEAFFNNKAYIAAHEYDYDIDTIVDVVKFLDNNDDAYLKMLETPAFNNDRIIEEKYDELEAFLVCIFSQSAKEAQRRIKYYQPLYQESVHKNYRKLKTKYQLIYNSYRYLDKIINKIQRL